MLLLCGFAVDFNFLTANLQINWITNLQIKILNLQFVDLRTCGSAQHCNIAGVNEKLQPKSTIKIIQSKTNAKNTNSHPLKDSAPAIIHPTHHSASIQ